MGMQAYLEKKYIWKILIIGVVLLMLYFIAIQYSWFDVEHKYYWSMALIAYVIMFSFALSLMFITGGCLALGYDRGWIRYLVNGSGFDLSNKWLLSIPSGMILIALGVFCAVIGALLIFKISALSQLLEVKFLL